MGLYSGNNMKKNRYSNLFRATASTAASENLRNLRNVSGIMNAITGDNPPL